PGYRVTRAGDYLLTYSLDTAPNGETQVFFTIDNVEVAGTRLVLNRAGNDFAPFQTFQMVVTLPAGPLPAGLCALKVDSMTGGTPTLDIIQG
ncbi:hypothetical protein ACI3GN_15395, partial [Lactiplantibacillus plantarum]|uniref:hypothetical protein n=1 Tax=Lactiplantibacillus plantarum TaxID=1590 RepID=UPI003854357F